MHFRGTGHSIPPQYLNSVFQQYAPRLKTHTSDKEILYLQKVEQRFIKATIRLHGL